MRFSIETNVPTQNDILKIKITSYLDNKKIYFLTSQIVGTIKTRNNNLVFLESVPVILKCRKMDNNSIENNMNFKEIKLNDLSQENLCNNRKEIENIDKKSRKEDFLSSEPFINSTENYKDDKTSNTNKNTSKETIKISKFEKLKKRVKSAYTNNLQTITNLNIFKKTEKTKEESIDEVEEYVHFLYLNELVLPSYFTENFCIEYKVVLKAYISPTEYQLFLKDFVVYNRVYDFLHSENLVVIGIEEQRISCGEDSFLSLVKDAYYRLVIANFKSLSLDSKDLDKILSENSNKKNDFDSIEKICQNDNENRIDRKVNKNEDENPRKDNTDSNRDEDCLLNENNDDLDNLHCQDENPIMKNKGQKILKDKNIGDKHESFLQSEKNNDLNNLHSQDESPINKNEDKNLMTVNKNKNDIGNKTNSSDYAEVNLERLNLSNNLDHSQNFYYRANNNDTILCKNDDVKTLPSVNSIKSFSTTEIHPSKESFSLELESKVLEIKDMNIQNENSTEYKNLSENQKSNFNDLSNNTHIKSIESLLIANDFTKTIQQIDKKCRKEYRTKLKPKKESQKIQTRTRKFAVNIGEKKIAELNIQDTFTLLQENTINIIFYKNVEKIKIFIKRIEKETNDSYEYVQTIYRKEVNTEYSRKCEVLIYLDYLHFFNLSCFYFLCTHKILLRFDHQEIEVPLRIVQPRDLDLVL